MYYTYRFKEHQPAFYFVKIKDRTKKELGFFNMVGNVFNGTFKDKYHFFVVQVVKNADVNNTNQKQYLVTSAMNDGDVNMSWNDLLKIEPRLSGLEEIFKPVALTPDEENDSNEFSNKISDDTYCKLEYARKKRYLEIYVKLDKLLSDTQFNCSPDDLKNLYISFGVALSNNQYESIKTNSDLFKRYKQTSKKVVEESLKNTNVILGITQILVLDENYRANILNGLTNAKISLFLKSFVDDEVESVATLIIQYKKDSLSDLEINNLLRYSKDDIIPNLILKYKKDSLTNDNINYLMEYSQSDKIAGLIFEYYKNIFTAENIFNLLRHTKNRDNTAIHIIEHMRDKLTDRDIFNLMDFSKDKFNIAIHIIENMRDKLTANNITSVFGYSNDRSKIATLILKYKKNGLSNIQFEILRKHANANK